MASAACTAAAGIGVSLTFIFKSCDNGSSTLPESSSVSIEENSSVDSVTDNSVDTANKENVDIFKSHNYPKLAGENDMSISQFAKTVDDSLDNMLSLLGYKGNVGQLAIIAEKDQSGTVMLTSKFANFYKSLPICSSLPSSDSADSECILKVSDYGIMPTQYALTTNGQTIQYIYIHSQFTDYKTIEEYDKIVAPDKAAKLLSEHLVPNLQDNEIVGMGLSYYPYYVGDIQAEPRIEGADSEKTQVYELTPFWTFYFDLDPSVIGLVDCKTGEVAYIHNDA